MSNGGSRPKPRYPHIKDLQAKADAAQDSVGFHTPVCVHPGNFFENMALDAL